MSVIQHVLKEELERLEELAHKYEDKVNSLPKGSLSRKLRNGKAYLYFAYRDKRKVIFKYIGKESSESSIKAKAQRDERQKYINSLRKVQKDMDEIRRVINGRRR